MIEQYWQSGKGCAGGRRSKCDSKKGGVYRNHERAQNKILGKAQHRFRLRGHLSKCPNEKC